MKQARSMALAALLSLSPLLAAPASAASYEIWDGAAWTPNGTVHLGGSMMFYVGFNIPCTTDLTLTLSGGVAQVSAAAFSGSSVCTTMLKNGLPWTVSAPTPYTGPNPPVGTTPLVTPIHNVTIQGFNVTLQAPRFNCFGNLTGQLDNTSNPGATSNTFVFNATLQTCKVLSLPQWTSSAPIRVVP